VVTLFRWRGFDFVELIPINRDSVVIRALKVGLCPTPFLFFLFSEKERTKEKPPEMPSRCD
jgi:hypothetical protein